MSESAQPGDLEALLEQGARLYAAGNSAAAAQVYRQAEKIAPEHPTVRLRLAMSIWHGENRGEEALAEVRALARDYPQAQVLGAEAMILNSLGRFEEAFAAAQKAIDVDPGHAGAWVDLATAAPAEEAAALVGAIGRVLQKAGDASARRQLHLARARLLRKTGDADAAFEAMAASNADAPARWDADAEGRQVEYLAEVFTPDLMRRLAGEGHADGRMIFIVGMPRSGTTMLERLLTAHPDVASAGETTLVGGLFGQLVGQVGKDPADLHRVLDGPNLRAMASAYLQGIATRVRGTPLRVIDKMPANHLFVPLIRLMFPRAAVIHLRRHPLDTCLSCWEAGFSFGLDYAARFDTLGAAYRLYARAMDRWSALPRTHVMDLHYEALVAASESAMRQVLRTCRLPWNPACLAPATGGQIKTASIAQAREAISTRSVGRWRVHGDRLDPLVAALGGWDWIEARSAG